MRARAAALLALATMGASWVDPHATARQASRLYADGKFGDAAAKYKEALIDDPDSVLLHYNAAAAAYRNGKFDDAIAALRQIPTSDADRARTARVAYNLGNATYKLGAAAEASKPEAALQRYAEALVAYRRAMGADPADQDAKLNHELVEKKIADLKKKLEEQKKQQDQQKQDDQQKQPQDQQQNQDQANQPQQQPPDQQQPQDQQQQQEQQQQGQQQADQQQPQDKPGGEQQEQQAEQKPDDTKPSDAANDQAAAGEQDDQGKPGEQGGSGEAVAGDETKSDLPRRDAEAILDAQRDQEVRPDEIVRKMQGARVAEPREDW